jgi:hypothetical protein
MSAPKIETGIDTSGEEYRARAAHNRALAERLRADVAKAALGGTEKHRKRHVERGKLLPRDRVERLLDPGSPFLEIGQLAAGDMYDGEVPGAADLSKAARSTPTPVPRTCAPSEASLPQAPSASADVRIRSSGLFMAISSREFVCETSSRRFAMAASTG